MQNGLKSELWEILVPTVFNDGRGIRKRYHQVWDQKVRDLSGGITILPVANGQWVSTDGQLFKERMIPVRIITDRATMEKIVRITLDHYEQLAVACCKISDEAFIIHADDKMKDAWKEKNKLGMKDYSWLGSSSSSAADAAV